MRLVAAARRVFPPEVGMHLVKMACELPEEQGRSLSLWTCAELARSLGEVGVVESISPQSVRVLCLDEKTSLQPRTRSSETRPPQPALVPDRLEHEYARKGALNLFAAFDTRTGEVMGILRRRKRQVEFIELLEEIDRATPVKITAIHLICDNVSVHHGKMVRAWLEKHPRFQMHFTPVHCSWMNQVEQWFSILQRKRMVAPNFQDLADLEAKIKAFIVEWNDVAHPFNWTRESFTKVIAKVDAAIEAAA